MNKAAIEIKANNRTLENPRINFQKSGIIYFSKSATRKFGFQGGEKVHFVSDTDRLYFFLNDDPRGFTLSKEDWGSSKVHSVMLMRTLNEMFPAKIFPKASFPLKRMSTKINNSETFEVLLGNRIKKVRRKKLDI